jgi:hypothetical protein
MELVCLFLRETSFDRDGEEEGAKDSSFLCL